MSAVAELKGKIEKKTVSGSDLLLLLSAIQEISIENDDIQELLADMKEEGEVIHLNMTITDLNNLTGSISIVEGKITAKKGRSEPSTLDLSITEEAAKKILKAELTIGQAYTSGLLKAKGNYTKILGLAIILEGISEKLNIT